MKFAKYPSCFGKLNLSELCDIARKHGITMISACKPNMHCFNEIGLSATAAAMKLTEAEWTAAGNKPKPRGFSGILGVDLNIPEDQWMDTLLATAQAAKLPITHGWPFTLQGGEVVTAPDGWRVLTVKELPTAKDFAWHLEIKGWTPLLAKDLEYYGPKRLKEVMYGIIRSKEPVKPQRIQLSRKKGWRLPPNTVIVSRPSVFGNPFHVTHPLARQRAVDLYRVWLGERICPNSSLTMWDRARQELRGKNLACWCRLDQPCHADVLLEIANS